MQFFIRVSRRSNGEVTSLYSPDFGMDLMEFNNHQQNCNSENYISEIFLNHLLSNVDHLFIPMNQERLGHIVLKDGQTWELIEIEFSPEYKSTSPGFFAKTFPRIGYFTNITKVVTSGYITFMALKVATSGYKDSSSSKLFSILGASLNSLVAATVYYYSDAPQMLSKIGSIADNLIFSKKSISSRSNLPMQNGEGNQQTIKISRTILSLLVGSLITANVVIMATSSYQESRSLCDKFLELDKNLSNEERERHKILIDWLVINLHISVGVFIALTFQGSFMYKLINDWDFLLNKFNKRLSQSNSLECINNCRTLFFRPFNNMQPSDMQTTNQNDPFIESRQNLLTYSFEA